MKKLNINKRIIFICFLLFSTWLILTIVYLIGTSTLTTNIKKNLDHKEFTLNNELFRDGARKNSFYGELLKGEVLNGEFVASTNYLGQVLIRFNNFNRINPDSVIFRIKEKDQENWFYENTYKTDQFQPNMFFTFGFPIIENSKNKTYLFEVESLDGKEDHAIGLSSVKPLGATLYQYPKKVLLSNPKVLFNFLIENKIKKIEFNLDTLKAFGIYLNFIIISLILIYLAINYLIDNFKIKFPKINSFNITFLGLLILILSAVILYIKLIEISFQLTMLGYFIIVFGIFFMIYENFKNNSK